MHGSLKLSSYWGKNFLVSDDISTEYCNLLIKIVMWNNSGGEEGKKLILDRARRSDANFKSK